MLLGDGGIEVIELLGRGFAPPPAPPHGAAAVQLIGPGAATSPAAPTTAAEDDDTPAAALDSVGGDAEAEAARAAAAADRDWITWRGLSSAPSAGMAGRLALVDHDLVSLGVTPVRVSAGLLTRVLGAMPSVHSTALR